MQYILTQEEYDELVNRGKERQRLQVRKLQELCTKIADTMPITRSWDKSAPPVPWGCILSRKDEWYCDHCPVQDICPSNRKHWSQ